MWTGALNFVVGATRGIPAMGGFSMPLPSGCGLPGFVTGSIVHCKCAMSRVIMLDVRSIWSDVNIEPNRTSDLLGLTYDRMLKSDIRIYGYVANVFVTITPIT